MMELPRLMVAPNGARRSKQDHPALPMTIAETVAAAKACHAAGADGLHLHVRGKNGEHLLDSALYREAILELKTVIPDMSVQITTEAVGMYQPHQQRDVVYDVCPDAVSISIAEMLSGKDTNEALEFYDWCNRSKVAVQHILYGMEDCLRLEALVDKLASTDGRIQLLFVLGRYTKDQESTPNDLAPFTGWLSGCGLNTDWAICAFGKRESDCLLAAHKAGGKIRVGFENSFWNANGERARDNAERVREIKQLIGR